MERSTDAAHPAEFLAFPAMTNTLTSLDTAAVEAFAGRVLTDFAGAPSTAMTVIGDRLGLYTALTGAGPVQAASSPPAPGCTPAWSPNGWAPRP